MSSRVSLCPQNLSKVAWYYEYPRYIEIIYEIRFADGTYLRTDHIRIPKWRLQKSLSRMVEE
jgi:hypothetical protein